MRSIRATRVPDEEYLMCTTACRHTLHWAWPQQMVWQCSAEWGRKSMWLGVLLCLHMLEVGSFLVPNAENGCVTAGYLYSVLSVYYQFV